MVRISVERASKLFGVYEGIKFWLEWRYLIKIELFYYRYVLRKKWCSRYGYMCKDKECKHQHYDKPLEYRYEEIMEEKYRV